MSVFTSYKRIWKLLTVLFKYVYGTPKQKIFSSKDRRRTLLIMTPYDTNKYRHILKISCCYNTYLIILILSHILSKYDSSFMLTCTFCFHALLHKNTYCMFAQFFFIHLIFFILSLKLLWLILHSFTFD